MLGSLPYTASVGNGSSSDVSNKAPPNQNGRVAPAHSPVAPEDNDLLAPGAFARALLQHGHARRLGASHGDGQRPVFRTTPGATPQWLSQGNTVSRPPRSRRAARCCERQEQAKLSIVPLQRVPRFRSLCAALARTTLKQLLARWPASAAPPNLSRSLRSSCCPWHGAPTTAFVHGAVGKHCNQWPHVARRRSRT